MALKLKGRLVRKQKEAPLVYSFVFELDQELTYTPGQYIFLSKKGVPDLKRPFSILNYKDKMLSLGIKKKGEFTSLLWNSELTEEFIIFGPYGRFSSTKNKTVFIAGGIGITPIFNMLINKTKNTQNYLFYSAKTQEEMPYLNEIMNLKNVKTNLFFTRKESNIGFNERISVNKISDKISNFKEYEFMICGSKNMIEEITNSLITAGINEEQIKSEEF